MHLLPPYQTDLHRLIGILQQWQCLLVRAPGAAAEATCSATTPKLTDVQALMQALQQTFGPMTTLEAVIQALIASDLRAQVEVRRQRRSSAPGPLLVSVA